MKPLTLLRGIGSVVIAVYLVLDSVLGPVFRPLARLIIQALPIAWLERNVTRLPPYGVLAVLAVPFAIAEPAKIIGLYIASEHPVIGISIIVAAYLISLVVVDRIYEAGRSQLFSIGWFASVMTSIIELRDRLKAFVQNTYAWRWARLHVRRGRAWLLRKA